MTTEQSTQPDKELVFACQATPALTLADLKPGETAKIHSVGLETSLGQRLLALGFLPGQPIRFLKNAPFGDPVLVEIGSRVVSMRREEAKHVVVGRDS